MLPTLKHLKELMPRLAEAAQSELDGWTQDEDGFDEVLGTGGACGLIADAMSNVLAEAGFETARLGTDFDGGHEFLVALCEEGVFTVDIPAGVYETGYGYSWKKRGGVTLSPDDVSLFRTEEPMSAQSFRRTYLDDPGGDWDLEP